MDLQKLNKNRISIKDVFDSKKKKIEIAGWVHNTRALGKIRFILLRDISGIIQITGVKGKVRDENFEIMDNLTREPVIYVKGYVVN